MELAHARIEGNKDIRIHATGLSGWSVPGGSCFHTWNSVLSLVPTRKLFLLYKFNSGPPLYCSQLVGSKAVATSCVTVLTWPRSVFSPLRPTIAVTIEAPLLPPLTHFARPAVGEWMLGRTPSNSKIPIWCTSLGIYFDNSCRLEPKKRTKLMLQTDTLNLYEVYEHQNNQAFRFQLTYYSTLIGKYLPEVAGRTKGTWVSGSAHIGQEQLGTGRG